MLAALASASYIGTPGLVPPRILQVFGLPSSVNPVLTFSWSGLACPVSWPVFLQEAASDWPLLPPYVPVTPSPVSSFQPNRSPVAARCPDGYVFVFFPVVCFFMMEL